MSGFNASKFLSTAGSMASRLTNTRELDGIARTVFGPGASKTLTRIINTAGSISTVADSEILNKATRLFGSKGSSAKLAPTDMKTPVDKDPVDSGPGNSEAEEVVVTAPIKYPLDLGDLYTRLEFANYKRPAPMQKPELVNTLTIYLPLPGQLVDAYNLSYDTPELGLFGSLADSLVQTANDDASKGTATGAGAAAAARVAQVAGATTAGRVAGAVAPSLGRLASLAVGASISQEATVVASQMTGAILNPNVSVAFKGPQLRQFSMSWEFAPHNPKESAELKKLIKMIRQRSLPSMTFENSRSILSYPQMVSLKISPDIIPYKRAMVTSINVDYASNGIPTFFAAEEGEDPQPTFIRLTMAFTEIEYFLSEDFGGESGKGLNEDLLDVTKNLATKAGDALNTAKNELGSVISNAINPQGG